jgi:hypothetical protein
VALEAYIPVPQKYMVKKGKGVKQEVKEEVKEESKDLFTLKELTPTPSTLVTMIILPKRP